LGNAGASSAGSSNVVRLIAGVSPAIQNFGDVTVKGMRYSVEGGQLQLNIEAKSFDTFEALRAKIAEAGFSVDLKSANAYGDVHQAQLRVSEAG
jgi:type II secretory pathway component PulL